LQINFAGSVSAYVNLCPGYVDRQVELPGSRILQARDHVRVDVERRRDRRVAEPFLHHLGVDVVLEEQGGVGVARIVEADSLESGRLRELAPSLGEAVGWVR